MSEITWTSWSLMIGTRAFKGVNPLALEVRPEVEHRFSGYLWWKDTWTEATGKWEIKFTYNTGPFTPRRTDIIQFDSENDARSWYDSTYRGVFLGQKDTQLPPPPKMKLPEKKKPSKPGLHLV